MTQDITAYGSAILWLSLFYHMFVGAAVLVSVQFTRLIAKKLYSLTLPENLDPRYEFVLKPLGTYAVMTTVLCGYALWTKNTEFRFFMLALLALLYVMRALVRLFYRDLFFRAYATPFKRNLVNIVFNLALAGSILIFGGF